MNRTSIVNVRLVNKEKSMGNADLGGADGLDLADITGMTWSNTLCPDYTNSDDNGGTCEGHRKR